MGFARMDATAAGGVVPPHDPVPCDFDLVSMAEAEELRKLYAGILDLCYLLPERE